MMKIIAFNLTPVGRRLRLAVALVMTLVTAVVQAQAPLQVGGYDAFYDSTTNRYLGTVAREKFGDSFTATVTAGNGWQVVAIDDTPLGTDGGYTFTNLSGAASWQVTLRQPSGETAQAQLQFTFLPIVLITGDIGYDYVDATMTLHEPGKVPQRNMAARMKWRGGTTNSASKHKRNYSVKFVDESGDKMNRRLLDLRRDNHWILDAGQVDLSRVRNRVATDLWLDLATEPYYFDQAPDALSGSRGKMVEVFLNDTYVGIYNLCEAVDRKQMALAKHDEDTGTFHGGLWKTDTYNNYTAFRQLCIFPGTSERVNGFEVKYPDFDEVNPTDWQVLRNAVEVMANYVSPLQFNEIVDDYFDIPVLIDYCIFLMALKADDNTAKNIYWACYDRATDRRLTIAVWDLDVTVGQSWNNATREDPTVFNRPQQWTMRMLCYPNNKYRPQMLTRYHELRQSWLSEQSLIARYDEAIDNLIACGAAAREVKRWSRDSDIRNKVLNFEDEKLFIEQWITTRMPLLDRFVSRCLGDVNQDGFLNAADVTTLTGAILNGDNTTEWVETYDINLDGAVNAADITTLYNAILGSY